MKWSNEYRVHYYYTDYNNVLKPSYIARYMQETAWNSLKTWGPTPEYLCDNNIAFILTKISFRYYEEIYEDDIITVETWANPAKTIIFPRNYRIYKNGRITTEAASAWVLLDVDKKSILRPDIIKDFKGLDDEELAFDVQKRIKMPDDMSFFSEYKVKYSDIDTNFHMNNSRYIDLICDNLYADDDIISPELKKRIISIDLNYNNEARFARDIEINKGVILCDGGENNKKTDEYYLKAKVNTEEHNCFEAKVVLTNK